MQYETYVQCVYHDTHKGCVNNSLSYYFGVLWPSQQYFYDAETLPLNSWDMANWRMS